MSRYMRWRERCRQFCRNLRAIFWVLTPEEEAIRYAQAHPEKVVSFMPDGTWRHAPKKLDTTKLSDFMAPRMDCDEVPPTKEEAMTRDEKTSKKVASKAAAALKDPKASAREKSLAGSALTQREKGFFNREVEYVAALLNAHESANAMVEDLAHALATIARGKPSKRTAKAKPRVKKR